MSTARSDSHWSSTATTLYLDPYDPLYPSSDGKPMADSTLQFQWIVTIKEGLQSLFEDVPDVFVAGDLLWYAVQDDPRDSMAEVGNPSRRRGNAVTGRGGRPRRSAGGSASRTGRGRRLMRRPSPPNRLDRD